MIGRCAAAVVIACVAQGWAPPALAFACYIGGPENGEATVHQQPDARAPIVARLPWNAMVGDGRRIRERDGWVWVRWSLVQRSQADFERGRGDGKGWIRRSAIRGECED